MSYDSYQYQEQLKAAMLADNPTYEQIELIVQYDLAQDEVELIQFPE